jgi:hypothetical protein
MVRGIMRAAAASPGPRVVAGIFGKPPNSYSEESAEVKASRLPPAWVETVYLR